MYKECRLGTTTIRYRVRRNRRARRANLTLKDGGEIVVTLPPSVSSGYAERLITLKAKWILKHLQALGSSHYMHLPSDHASFEEHRERALTLACERVAHFEKTLGVRVEGVRVKNQKTQWGSCSESGFLNINYRIVFLPPHLADYVIVHELCHRVHLNHSSGFQELLGSILPERHACERELRCYRFG